MLGDWACVGQVVQFQGTLEANANVGSKRQLGFNSMRVGDVENVVQVSFHRVGRVSV